MVLGIEQYEMAAEEDIEQLSVTLVYIAVLKNECYDRYYDYSETQWPLCYAKEIPD